MNKLIFIFIVLALSLTTLSAQYIVTTDDGRNVLLKSDGTWEYYDQSVFSAEFQEFTGSDVPTFTDPDSFFVMRVHKIFIGKLIAEKGLAYAFEIEKAHNQGKELIFIDVSIKKSKGTDATRISFGQFMLEDNRGYSYKSKYAGSSSSIEGDVHPSKIIRGGILFAIYEGNVPERLIFDPDVILSRGYYQKKLEIIAEGLSKLEIFTNANHEK